MKAIDPARWQQIEDALDRVLDAPDDDRERVLAEVCAGDDELRREVVALLHAAETAGNRFDTPPLLVARDALESSDLDRDQVSSGDLIGPYRVVRLLGRGGMGAVYLAERADGTFEKNVALKIVKRGMDTDEIIHRFHHERRILGRLAHPNIAGILDGGRTPDGLPYFAMELAEGQPIDEWCDRHTLTIRERLALFQTVCAAVQYAHGNLVVHRDLKPGNIFVSDGEVKLLDFGIAKLLGPDTDGPSVTQAWAARLTPQYAAPEQIRGLATSTSADVYSLGVILYELLCGRSPYRLEGRTLLEMEQTICTEEPPPASVAVWRVQDGVSADDIARARGLSRAESLEHILRGDLDAICAKSLSKKPEDRYISAAALSDDIQRYLEGRPVRAHPPLRGYRLRKFVERNRTMVTLSSASAITLIAAMIVTFVMFTRAREASRLRQEEAERATAALGFVVNMFSGFDPYASAADGGELSPEDIVNRGLDQLPSLDNQPRVQATVMNSLAQVALSLGLVNRADSLYQQAIARLDSIVDAREFAVSLMGLGEVRRQQLQFLEAEQYFRRAAAFSASQADPVFRARSESALAFSLYNVGDSARLAEADSIYRALIQLPGLPVVLQADLFERLGDVETARHNHDDAVRHYEEAIRLRSQVLGENSPANARGMFGPVLALLGLGDFHRAEELARTSRRILEGEFGAYHRDVAWANLYLGFALDSLSQHDSALVAFRRAAMISDSIEGPGGYYAGRARYWAARSLMRMRRFREAERELRESLRIFALPLDVPTEPAGIADSEYWLGRLLAEEQRYTEALQHFRSAAMWSERARNPARTAQAAEDVARLYEILGVPDSAAAWRQRVVSAAGT